MTFPRSKVALAACFGLTLAIVLGIAVYWSLPAREHPAPVVTAAQRAANLAGATIYTNGAGEAAIAPAGNSVNGKPLPLYADFQVRPLAVARESAHCAWTAEDGRQPDVIRRLAHNDIEYQRMLDENPRIKERQLVYLKEPAALAVQESRLTGQPLQSLVLPGTDGQEFKVDITSADVSDSGQIGTFNGYIDGHPESAVSVAFKFGREAYTILSPADGNYFDAESRESGEVVVKSFDPNVYSPLSSTDDTVPVFTPATHVGGPTTAATQ
jgi:hypothetical protein